MLLSSTAFAADEAALTIKDDRFVPTEFKVPAGKKIKLVVETRTPPPKNSKSHDLNREKVIAPKSKATIFHGPLKTGTYKFYGEFNQATAQGAVIAE